MITINTGCATPGTPIFGYIVDRNGSLCKRLAGAGSTSTVGIIG